MATVPWIGIRRTLRTRQMWYGKWIDRRTMQRGLGRSIGTYVVELSAQTTDSTQMYINTDQRPVGGISISILDLVVQRTYTMTIDEY